MPTPRPRKNDTDNGTHKSQTHSAHVQHGGGQSLQSCKVCAIRGQHASEDAGGDGRRCSLAPPELASEAQVARRCRRRRHRPHTLPA